MGNKQALKSWVNTQNGHPKQYLEQSIKRSKLHQFLPFCVHILMMRMNEHPLNQLMKNPRSHKLVVYCWQSSVSWL
jgi:hypothetical protein